MSEQATEVPTPAAPEAAAATESPSTPPTPPWGDDFTPEKAWDKIQKANREAANLRQRAMTPEQQKQLEEYNALVEASKSEAQRLAETAQAAQRDAESARAEAIRYKAAATHGISADYFDLLGTGTEEQISANAEKIAALLAAQAAAAQTVTPPATRPVEQLRPGATPAGTESEDDVVMAKLFGPPPTS